MIVFSHHCWRRVNPRGGERTSMLRLWSVLEISWLQIKEPLWGNKLKCEIFQIFGRVNIEKVNLLTFCSVSMQILKYSLHSLLPCLLNGALLPCAKPTEGAVLSIPSSSANWISWSLGMQVITVPYVSRSLSSMYNLRFVIYWSTDLLKHIFKVSSQPYVFKLLNLDFIKVICSFSQTAVTRSTFFD